VAAISSSNDRSIGELLARTKNCSRAAQSLGGTELDQAGCSAGATAAQLGLLASTCLRVRATPDCLVAVSVSSRYRRKERAHAHGHTRSGLAAVVLLASGCATLTKGASQTITVSTDPPGAICELTRDAKLLAVVNPTPGPVSISKAPA
jgi:anti-sigma factor RsiW